MTNRRGWIAAVAISICLAAVLLASADSAHPANAGGVVDPTCTSSSPCIEYDNSSTGQGVKGFSHQGNGLTGWTGWNSTSSANSKYGVVGNDQSTAGNFDGGVLGKSSRGTGVSGVSEFNTGVSGVSELWVGVYGSSTDRIGVEGTSDIVGVSGYGGEFAVRAEVTGTDSDGAGVYSETDNPESWIVRGYSNYHAAYTFEVADDGTVYAKAFSGGLAARTLQKTATGRSLDTYAHQVSQPTLEDYGEAQLVNGIANVSLEPRFADAIDRTSGYLVTVTPEGDCRGLYVALRTRAGFIVRELQGGRSSIAFSYRIVAKPFGDTSARLPLASVPRGFTPNSERPSRRAMPRRH